MLIASPFEPNSVYAVGDLQVIAPRSKVKQPRSVGDKGEILFGIFIYMLVPDYTMFKISEIKCGKF